MSASSQPSAKQLPYFIVGWAFRQVNGSHFGRQRLAAWGARLQEAGWSEENVTAGPLGSRDDLPHKTPARIAKAGFSPR